MLTQAGRPAFLHRDGQWLPIRRGQGKVELDDAREQVAEEVGVALR